MKNNKGLSYVELMVVIVIMIVLTTVSTLSITYMTRTNANKTADKLVTALTTSRANCLAKGEEKGAFHIRCVGSTYEYAIGRASDGLNYETIASSPVQIGIVDSSNNLTMLTPGTGDVVLRFNPSNGSVATNNAYDVSAFYIYRNDQLVTTVRLYQLTGKCEIVLP